MSGDADHTDERSAFDDFGAPPERRVLAMLAKLSDDQPADIASDSSPAETPAEQTPPVSAQVKKKVSGIVRRKRSPKEPAVLPAHLSEPNVPEENEADLDAALRDEAAAGRGGAVPLPGEQTAEEEKEPDPHYVLHRKRVRDRFLRVGGEAFADYELLELLLFRSLPRRDTKPLAKALLKEFGSFAEVLGAALHRIQVVPGIGELTAIDLKIYAAAAQRMGRGSVFKREALTSWESVLLYCRTAMAFEEREQFRILFLNKKNLLIADEVQQRGTVDHTPAYPREVVQRAVNLGSTAIILVHNHPSGDPEPSRADIDLTRAIAAVAKGMNVIVLDHVIVGRNGHASLKAMGYLS